LKSGFTSVAAFERYQHEKAWTWEHQAMTRARFVLGPEDMAVNKQYGGRMVYWNEPDGHQWEMLTVSYAR
jgi:glutamine synthetase adenylyltransferase